MCVVQSSASTVGANASIVGDLLDYLNESWTHFHATGILINFCIFVSLDFWFF